MKTLVLVILLIPTAVGAQQRSAGEAFYDGFMRGQQIRQAAEARKAAAEKRQAEELQAQIEAAYNDPMMVIESRNGLPDILLSNKSLSICSRGSIAAFTRDAHGQLIYGCADPSGEDLKVDWASYGTRTYKTDEWQEKEPRDADHEALGAH